MIKKNEKLLAAGYITGAVTGELIMIGGYYLYAMISGTKTYISMVKAMGTDGKEHINGKYETAPSTVYTWDAEAKTLVADIDGEAYWHGTRSDKSYNTVGPCAVSFNGFYCQFYA